VASRFGGFAHYETSVASLFADDASPNEPYFVHADWVLRARLKKLFWSCSFRPMLAGIAVHMAGIGRWWPTGRIGCGSTGACLGRCYRDFTNILWLRGGDHNPPDKGLVRAIAEGIREFDTRALHTAHEAPETLAIDYWRGESWLQVSNVYTYEPVYAPRSSIMPGSERMPFVLIEMAYEDKHRVSERDLRTQAYQAMLSGASGQIFGNDPIWHFDGPGLSPGPITWQEAPGESRRPEHDASSQPPEDPAVVVAQAGRGQRPSDRRARSRGRACGGGLYCRSDDRCRLPAHEPRDHPRFRAVLRSEGDCALVRAGQQAVLRVSGSPFPVNGLQLLQPDPGGNNPGFDDWALILESTT
jgi:hypothetical protein